MLHNRDPVLLSCLAGAIRTGIELNGRKKGKKKKKKKSFTAQLGWVESTRDIFLSDSVSLWGSKLTILYGVLRGIYHLTLSVHVPVLLEYGILQILCLCPRLRRHTEVLCT